MMKKIFFAFALVIGFTVAANAQSNSNTTNTDNQPAKVEVGGKTVSAEANQESAESKKDASSHKSCCSSKNGKESASAGKKGCCADGKKTSANCHDAKKEDKVSE